MRYEERTLVALVCDRCGMRGPWALYRKAARVWAEMNGWKVDGDAALCPDCQEQDAGEGKKEEPDAETEGRPDTGVSGECPGDASSR